jgi:hypothetical protein
MPGDPKECREQAFELLEDGKHGARLATSLENAQVLMDQWSDPSWSDHMPKKKAR